MTQKDAPARAEKLSSLNPASSAIDAMASKHFEEFAKVQSDLLQEIRQANQDWLDRIQSEAALASEFTSKLTASHSIADTTTAKGLRVTCRLDRRKYPAGRKVSDQELAEINITPSRFHGEWNYIIRPHAYKEL